MPLARTAALTLLAVPALAAAQPPPVTVDVNVNVDVNIDAEVRNRSPQRAPIVVVAPPATPVPEPGPGPDYVSMLEGHRWEAAVLLEGGPMAIADVAGGQFSVRGVIARQLGRLRLGLEGSVGTFGVSREVTEPIPDWPDTWPDDWETPTRTREETYSGEILRYGAVARYRAIGTASVDSYTPAQVAFYVEVGLGRQHIAWKGGGETARSDLAAGLGLEVAGVGKRSAGLELGVRVLASPTLDRGSGCGAVCTRASADRTHDLGVMFHLGATFGS